MTMVLMLLVVFQGDILTFDRITAEQKREGEILRQRALAAVGFDREPKLEYLTMTQKTENLFRARFVTQQQMYFQVEDLSGVILTQSQQVSAKGFDGQTVWQRDYFDIKERPFPVHQMTLEDWRDRALQQYPLFLVKSLPVAALPEQIIDQELLLVLAIYRPGAKAETPLALLYLNPVTGRPRAYILAPSAERSERNHIYWLDDYREVNGHWFPFSLRVEGRLPRKITIESILFNVPPADNFFNAWPEDKPKAWPEP